MTIQTNRFRRVEEAAMDRSTKRCADYRLPKEERRIIQMSPSSPMQKWSGCPCANEARATITHPSSLL